MVMELIVINDQKKRNEQSSGGGNQREGKAKEDSGFENRKAMKQMAESP